MLGNVNVKIKNNTSITEMSRRIHSVCMLFLVLPRLQERFHYHSLLMLKLPGIRPDETSETIKYSACLVNCGSRCPLKVHERWCYSPYF